MNVEELQLKKKWDEKMHQAGVLKCFEDVFFEEYENLESWLKLYFKDLSFEDKCQIIGRAGWNVSTKLKGLVENHELVSFNLYSWILTHDINDLHCKISSKNDDIVERMKEDESINNDKINLLNTIVERLQAEIADLKSKIEELKNT